MSESITTAWIKASKSGGNGGDCIEMRRHDGAVEVRDTKDSGQGVVLRLTPTSFTAWVEAAKRGELHTLA